MARAKSSKRKEASTKILPRLPCSCATQTSLPCADRFYRAGGLARTTIGALIGVDFILPIACADRLNRAGTLTSATHRAVIRNDISHDFSPSFIKKISSVNRGEDTIYFFSFIPKKGCVKYYIEIKSKELEWIK